MNAARRRGACPALTAPMQTGDGLLVRLNPVAGGLASKALIGLCESASRHGNGIMEVTARGSIQIRGLTATSAAVLAAEVNALGIAVRTGVPVETGPLAGLDLSETADPRALAEAIRAAIYEAGLAGKLGPKVSVVVDGGGLISLDAILADVRLVAVRRDGSVSWHLSIGGTATTARPLGLFDEARASDLTMAILKAIATLGREGRARDLDTEQLTERSAVAPEGVIESPSEKPLSSDSFPIGIFPLTNSAEVLGIALPFGSMPAQAIARLAAEAVARGASEIRPSPQRTLLFLGLTRQAGAELRQAAGALGFVTEASDPRTHIAACPGTPACASGHLSTRGIAETIAADHTGFLDGSFTLHISGCAKGCAHPAAAALTLVGDENKAGLVVDGTAKALPPRYSPRYEAARGLGRVAALAGGARRDNETVAACLARLGETAITQAFARE
ncbi:MULTISPECIES: precorrin-3B synthase [Phyllobacteriaceae]|jgi:precorrin-3B synthase|uniref:Precorrin-3B synthase n=1 Tax=Mesorhizobium hungaricum TaxID=1566387 RepID=A0A1C2DNU5_9HYPH|nr:MULTISPECIES: precorrin-3B synthase [Mesorhizobium]MBN9233636.1 precorrin-3B synthase [Mesorhizobium sp.]MDQ0328556.1 precorrin-3B synthase [Mesorhizobium sp. YL-MeA3-2017]OCX16444.1 precorrin-3B synthase [Mesorhizobium hungaricum]